MGSAGEAFLPVWRPSKMFRAACSVGVRRIDGARRRNGAEIIAEATRKSDRRTSREYKMLTLFH